MTFTQAALDERTSAVRQTALVDCDVHPVVADISRLRPHMSKRAARRVFGPEGRPAAYRMSGQPIVNRLPHPSTALRADARTRDGGPPGSDPAYTIEHWLDPHAITAALLIPVQAGLVLSWGDETAGTELLGALNQYLYEHWVAFDRRYRLVIAVSPYDARGAVAEIEKYAGLTGVAGVLIPYGAVELGRSHYDPVYEAAANHGLPVVMHQTGGEGNVSSSPRLGGGLPSTWVERHAQLTQPGQAILVSMVFGGTFARFPSLKLLLAEFGFSWLPWILRRMDRAWELGDRALAGLDKAPSEYVREQVRFSTQPLDEPPGVGMLADYLDTWELGRVLVFSSDYPHYDNDNPQLTVSRMPAHLRDQVAFQNAQEFFGKRIEA